MTCSLRHFEIPLFDLDEETLFSLAYERGRRTLHARLMEHAGGLDLVGRAADRLLRYRRLADSHSVFAFYSAVLTETRQQKVSAPSWRRR